MLQNLIAQIREKPAELEEVLARLDEARQKLVQLNEAKQIWEVQVALEVAKDKQYSNDTLRKAEMARRLKETPEVQEIDKAVAATKAEVASLEVKAERIKWELRSAQALLQLAAAAVQAGNQEVLAVLVGQQEAKQEAPQEEKQEKANGPVEMVVKVLGAMPAKKDGVVKALVEDKQGNRFEVYANGKGNAAKKICQSINGVVTLKLKRLDSGNWFAVAVA
ncbi:hypothetical protein [Desulfovirgula thermocuniculi]|uniref:hypothetical protein n=1 Tax=Desulfovirgula thermocuniculi TaxID=348842 RepID=UPI00040D67CF|nr:hypothetical protein [Desulfovirgula thermocuniculi]